MLCALKITRRTHARRGESLVGAGRELPLLAMPPFPIPSTLVLFWFLHFPLLSSHAMLPQQILLRVRPAGTHGAAGTGLARFQVISKTDRI